MLDQQGTSLPVQPERYDPKHYGVVLAYHNIEDRRFTGQDPFTVTKGNFYDQLLLLKRYCTVIGPPETGHTAGTAKPPVWITFDDGRKNNITHAFPMLLKAGVSAFFFVLPGFFTRDGFMNEQDIRILAAHNMGVGSHSVTHPDFGTLTELQAEREFRESKGSIETVTGMPGTLFSYPYGNPWNMKERDIALLKKTGYTHAYTLGIDPHDTYANPYRIPRFLVTDIRGNTLVKHIYRLTQFPEIV